jgi:hypothetical protein
LAAGSWELIWSDTFGESANLLYASKFRGGRPLTLGAALLVILFDRNFFRLFLTLFFVECLRLYETCIVFGREK